MDPGLTLTGVVVTGNRMGRTIGFPTANLAPVASFPENLAKGVYAVRVKVGETWYPGMANIGTRPTLGLQELTVEAHLFDFSGDLYGRAITIHFIKMIREEKKFSGIEELKAQLENDSIEIRALFFGGSDPDSDPV